MGSDLDRKHPRTDLQRRGRLFSLYNDLLLSYGGDGIPNADSIILSSDDPPGVDQVVYQATNGQIVLYQSENELRGIAYLNHDLDDPKCWNERILHGWIAEKRAEGYMGLCCQLPEGTVAIVDPESLQASKEMQRQLIEGEHSQTDSPEVMDRIAILEYADSQGSPLLMTSDEALFAAERIPETLPPRPVLGDSSPSSWKEQTNISLPSPSSHALGVSLLASQPERSFYFD